MAAADQFSRLFDAQRRDRRVILPNHGKIHAERAVCRAVACMAHAIPEDARYALPEGVHVGYRALLQPSLLLLLRAEARRGVNLLAVHD